MEAGRERGLMRRSLPLALALLVVLGAAGCSRQESAWRSARAEDTVQAYERYLLDFPAGTHVNAARARLVALRDALAWRQALRVDEPEAYQRYLATHPEGYRTAEARARLADFLHRGKTERAGPLADTEVQGPAAQEDAGRRVQLGAFGDERAARDAWQRLKVRHPDLLAGLTAGVDASVSGDVMLWRLQAGPVDETTARTLCAALESRGSPCLVLAE